MVSKALKANIRKSETKPHPIQMLINNKIDQQIVVFSVEQSEFQFIYFLLSLISVCRFALSTNLTRTLPCVAGF